MKKTISSVIIFCIGAAVGGGAVWLYAKKKYSEIAEEEIESVKATYADKYKHFDDDSENKKQREEPLTEANDIIAYAKTIEREKYAKYSQPSDTLKTNHDICVISPEEFGENEEYGQVSYFYFSDAILADEYGEVVTNSHDILGDGLDHFGDYEEDSVYIRNDTRCCYYEILRDLRPFSEFLKTLPPKF